MLMAALDAMSLKFALAVERELPDCSWFVPPKASINSSLCSLRANAASSSWPGIPLLLLPPASLLNISRSSASLLRNLCTNGVSSSSWFHMLVLVSLFDTLVEGWWTLVFLYDTREGRAFRLIKSLLVFLSELWCSFWFFQPDSFFAATSWGNRSCIVFQRTVLTVQDLLLLQFPQYKQGHCQKNCLTTSKSPIINSNIVAEFTLSAVCTLGISSHIYQLQIANISYRNCKQRETTLWIRMKTIPDVYNNIISKAKLHYHSTVQTNSKLENPTFQALIGIK